MGAAIGAALKKIGAALLTDKNVLKTIGMVILVLVVALLLPLMAMMAILSGDIQLDTDALMEQIEMNLTAKDIAMLSRVEDTMEAIDTALTDAEMPSRVGEAQALYIMALYSHSGSSNFVSRLVSCFRENQTDSQLISAVNSTFRTDISVEEFTRIAQNMRTTYIDYSDYYDPTTKNNLDLVQWAIEVHSSGWGYVWGTYGHVLTRNYYEMKLEQYPEGVGDYADFILANWLGKRTADCVGLVKGYCWFDPETQSIGYGVNGMPDIGTEQMIQWCEEKGSIDTMPEIPGLLLWMNGHVGIYIGDGYAIEAMGTRYGVVKTQVAGRGWKLWGKIPCIEYIEEVQETDPPVAASFISNELEVMN